MLDSKQLRSLSKLRLDEAKILAANNFFDGAKYLAGYSVELLLKAKVCENLDIPLLYDNNFKELNQIGKVFKTHNLNHLLYLSGRHRKFQKQKAKNEQLFANWSFINTEWSEHCRYNTKGSISKKDCKKFLTAIQNRNHGFITWLKRN